MKSPLSHFSVQEVTVSTWPDFETLFTGKGAPGYCWCMAWRATAEERRNATRATRRAALQARVANGIPVGLIGYLDGEPIAWCSVAPSTTYRRLRKDVEPSDDVWSVACFFVRREHRGKGFAKALLDAAVRHATRRGARVIEGYPVEHDSPSYRFMGFVSLFEEAGFHRVARAGARRQVYCRRIT